MDGMSDKHSRSMSKVTLWSKKGRKNAGLGFLSTNPHAISISGRSDRDEFAEHHQESLGDKTHAIESRKDIIEKDQRALVRAKNGINDASESL